MKLSIISCCGHRGVETTEGFAHIAMETVVHGSVDETNPSLLPPLFYAILKPGAQVFTLRGSPSPQPLLTNPNRHKKLRKVWYRNT